MKKLLWKKIEIMTRSDKKAVVGNVQYCIGTAFASERDGGQITATATANDCDHIALHGSHIGVSEAAVLSQLNKIVKEQLAQYNDVSEDEAKESGGNEDDR